MIELTKITLDCDCDGYYVVFIDGKLFLHGDQYHEKIIEKFNGIQEFLKFQKLPFKVKEMNFKTKGEDAYYDWDYQPDAEESSKDYIAWVKKFSVQVK